MATFNSNYGAGGWTLVFNSKMKGVRLVFYSCEVHLMDERARKNAKMAPFNSNYGAGGWTRTNEARSARDLQSLVIATRRLQQ